MKQNVRGRVVVHEILDSSEQTFGSGSTDIARRGASGFLIDLVVKDEVARIGTWTILRFTSFSSNQF